MPLFRRHRPLALNTLPSLLHAKWRPMPWITTALFFPFALCGLTLSSWIWRYLVSYKRAWTYGVALSHAQNRLIFGFLGSFCAFLFYRFIYKTT